ncbi:MAG TPA: hypothetical protein VIV40_36775 [Kofleriaceae bacterium]
MPTRPSPIAAIPALLLVVVALWETCATPRYASDVPGDKTWQKAAALVRAGYQPGDLIVFAPAWNDPVGRLHLGDLIPIETAARMDAARFARIWELSIRGARAPETTGLTPETTKDIGGVTVKLYTHTPAIVVADVLTALPTIRVEGSARPTLELTEVGFAPHRCIQIVPPQGSSVRITFPQLPLGRELVGYVGLADVFTRRSPRGPGKLEIQVGGAVVARVSAGVDDGWVRFAAPTTPGPADVTFIASAADPNRLICFAAEARQ